MIAANTSALKDTRPREYLLRFVFGGAATVLAGIIAKCFGPQLGGLFLAFPAIFPATVTLIEAHERQRKAKIGHDGTNRGRLAASIDAAGASLGCIGLAGFAVVLWITLPKHGAPLDLAAAFAAWLVISIVLWKVRKTRIFKRRLRRSN